MSLLGKILAVLNIFGVVAFGALALMDYAKRQAWSYANFRHELALTGLPIDETDEAVRDRKGVYLVNRLTDQTVKELFPAEPVRTQQAEAERVEKALRAKLGELESDRPKQIAQLARILQPLAQTSIQRERTLSALAYLDDDKTLTQLKEALTAAMPLAIDAVRHDPKRLSFEKALQDALRDLPGDDRWDLVLAFLQKLPREGQTFEKAAEAGKAMIEDVKNKATAKDKADEALEAAKIASFVADAEYQADPSAEKKQKKDDLHTAMDTAAKKATEAAAAAKQLPDPREAGAVAFLQTIRNDKTKTTVAKFVDEVVAEMLDVLHDDFSKEFDQFAAEAVQGVRPLPDGGTADKEARGLRLKAIARFLLVGLEVLHPEVLDKSAEEIGTDPQYRRFINVVGIDMAATAVNEQVIDLASVYDGIERTLGEERIAFWKNHTIKLSNLRKRANEIERLDERLKEVAKQAVVQADIDKKEKERVDAYVAELKTSRQLTDKAMKNLEDETRLLFDVRIAIRDAIRNNQKYLRQIVELEDEVRYLESEYDRQVRNNKKKRTKTAP